MFQRVKIPRATRHLIHASLLFLALATLAPASDAEMYRWVDDNGTVHYSDRVPPQYAKQKREILNERGQVIDVKERQATAAERDAAERERKAKTQARAEAEAAAAYNRSLTGTYNNVEQLDAAYADRLDLIDGKIRAAQKNLSEIEETLNGLRERAEGKAPAKLDKRIRQIKTRMREQEEIVARLRADKTEVAERQEADRALYLKLTAGQ